MATPNPDLFFGALAVKNGYATPSEIELALDAQKTPEAVPETPLKLGEILRDMGTLTPTQVQSVLEAQTRLRQNEPGLDLGATTTMTPLRPVESPAFVQESGDAVTVNDEPLRDRRKLKAGDRLKVGTAVLRFVPGTTPDLEIELQPVATPAPAEPLPLISPSPEGSAPATPALPPPAPRRLAEPLMAILRKIDGRVARIPPALHTQRKYVLAAAAIAWLTLLLPWRVASNGNTVLGIQGPGWLTSLVLLVPLAITLVTRPSEPFTKLQRLIAGGASGLAVLLGIWKIAFPPAYATGRGFGLFVSLIAGVGVLAAAAMPRAGGGSAGADSMTLGTRLGQAVLRLFATVSGKRAKELTASIEQRDDLYRKIGEAALAASSILPEAAAAAQAREAFQRAEKEAAQETANGQVRAKAAMKAADAKARRLIARLGQRTVESGALPAGHESAAAALKALESKIKELS